MGKKGYGISKLETPTMSLKLPTMIHLEGKHAEPLKKTPIGANTHVFISGKKVGHRVNEDKTHSITMEVNKVKSAEESGEPKGAEGKKLTN